MNSTEDVVEVGTLMQTGDVFFTAGVVFAFDAETNVELAFEGVSSALNERNVGVEFTLRHAHGRPEAIRHWTVAGEDDAFEAGFDGLLGIFFGFTPSMLTQGRMHV